MLLVVAPAYNEELNIADFIRKTSAFLVEHNIEYRMIIVDDGSNDRTVEIIEAEKKVASLPITIVSYKPNRGPGEAFRRGLHEALRFGDDAVIMTMEADGTGDLKIIPALIEKIRCGADVVIGSCHADGGKMEGKPEYRLFLSRSVNRLVTALFHMQGLKTLTCFYRAYRPAALRKVLAKYGEFSSETNFSSVVEILIRFAKLRLRMEEVPMILRGQNRVGKSKMKVVSNILTYARIILRNAFSR